MVSSLTEYLPRLLETSGLGVFILVLYPWAPGADQVSEVDCRNTKGHASGTD